MPSSTPSLYTPPPPPPTFTPSEKKKKRHTVNRNRRPTTTYLTSLHCRVLFYFFTQSCLCFKSPESSGRQVGHEPPLSPNTHTHTHLSIEQLRIMHNQQTRKPQNVLDHIYHVIHSIEDFVDLHDSQMIKWKRGWNNRESRRCRFVQITTGQKNKQASGSVFLHFDFVSRLCISDSP